MGPAVPPNIDMPMLTLAAKSFAWGMSLPSHYVHTTPINLYLTRAGPGGGFTPPRFFGETIAELGGPAFGALEKKGPSV